MQTTSPTDPRLRDFTSVAFEVFVVAFTALPFFALAYFYPALPERVPVFLNLGGGVATWAAKGAASVFRVPLMALDTQLICLLAKYGTVRSEAAAPPAADPARAALRAKRLRLNAGVWDWLRFLVAVKMCASSLDTVFLGVGRLKPFAGPAYAVAAAAALLGVAGGIFYVRRTLALGREARREFGGGEARAPVDARRVYGGFLYFDPSDPAPFVRGYLLNLGNRWAWALVACVAAYPLLVFLPA